MGGASWGKVTAADARRQPQRSAHPQLLRRGRAGRRRSPVVVPAVGHLRAAVRRLGERHLAVPGRRAGRDDRRRDQPTITLPQGNQTLRVREFGDARLPNVAGLDLSFRKYVPRGQQDVRAAHRHLQRDERVHGPGPRHAARTDLRTCQRHSEGAVDQGRVERGVLD